MTTHEANVRDSRGIQDCVASLEVNLKGVARLEDIEGTTLAQAALALLPSCASIVVFGAEVYPEFLDLTKPERIAGAARMNDLLERHVDYLRGRLTRASYAVARAARAAGFKALPLPGGGPSVDSRFLTAVIPYKAAAEAAGLGEIGMSGLLVTREYGPRVQLAVCLTEAALISTARDDARGCRYCNVCVFRCPAGAIGYPDRSKDERCAVNRFACAQYVTSAGGCSECLRVCPVASPKYE
jgi:epoxyqueuosine reductase QueG